MNGFCSYLFIIIITCISCNGAVNILPIDLNGSHTLSPMTMTPSTTKSFFVETSTTSTNMNEFDGEYRFDTLNIFGMEIDFCYEASLISEACALFQIIECLIFYIYRNEDGIQSRRPIFTFSFCVISLIYFLFIIPGICSTYTIDMELLPFFAWYLLRCICIFLWFWSLICKYWFLYFDYNYVILLRLQALHIEGNRNDEAVRKSLFNSPTGALKTQWRQKHKKDFGNPKKASLCIAIYFVLCFLVLVCIAIVEHFFADVHEIYIIHYYHLLHAYFSNVYLAELLFIFMCFVPFTTAVIFTCRIANFRESWKIKQEMWTIFIISGAIFTMDAALTCMIYLDESTRFALKFMCEALILFWSTAISTIFVTVYIVQKRNKSQKRRRHKKKSTSLYRHKASRKKTASSIILSNHYNSREHMLKMSAVENVSDNIEMNEEIDIPLGYILSNQLGYSAFLQHCTDELNLENLLFLAHVCYFKKKFLDRIKDRQLQQNDAYDEDIDKIEEEQVAGVNTITPLTVSILPPVDETNLNNEEEEALIEDSEPFIELQSVTTPSISPRARRKPTNSQTDTSTKHFSVRSCSDNLDIVARPFLDKYASSGTIRTDIAVYDEHEDDACAPDEELFAEYPDVVEWTADNSLAILTFRMCHNFERQSRSERLEALDDESVSKEIIMPSLYMLANDIYTIFVCENSEYEINLPSKLRTTLHFFFHQNFTDLEVEDQQFYEYRLFHIFDKSWAEIWQLLSLNSYRRFLNTEHYQSIQHQLQMGLIDELPELYRLILTHVNDDRHIGNIIDSHDPQKRQKIGNIKKRTRVSNTAGRIRSLNFEEIHDLAPTALVNIDVKPLPVDEQVHHFGRTINMVRVKKAKV